MPDPEGASSRPCLRQPIQERNPEIKDDVGYYLMPDPLSPATRAMKRNLLIASVVAISANAFKVSIDRIPMGGLSVSLDVRLFCFPAVIVLLYFLATFLLYYAIDIRPRLFCWVFIPRVGRCHE
jgi:hypothetical protein